jgi:hypothetical protein
MANGESGGGGTTGPSCGCASTPVLTSSLRFTGGFHDSERADVLEVLAPLERHLARWAADEVDVQMSVVIDNVEWAYGYWPRFGLTYVDYPSQRRTVKHRGEVYAAIIRANAERTRQRDISPVIRSCGPRPAGR